MHENKPLFTIKVCIEALKVNPTHVSLWIFLANFMLENELETNARGTIDFTFGFILVILILVILILVENFTFRLLEKTNKN